MMKFTAWNGDMFSCGWLPPAEPTAAPFIAPVAPLPAVYRFVAEAAGTFPVGSSLFPLVELQATAWLWLGLGLASVGALPLER